MLRGAFIVFAAVVLALSADSFTAPAPQRASSNCSSPALGKAKTSQKNGRPFARRRHGTSALYDLKNYGTDDTLGTKQGVYLFGLVGLLCVWIFSVPVEFRRARMCSEEQVKTAAPEKHCMTFGDWRQGIADYYSNGGGVNFDFSIEGK